MRFRFEVRGRVQGVGYRWFVVRAAAPLQIRGYVRNLSDGSVEVVADGDPGALDALEIALRRGPRQAQVNQVERSPIASMMESFMSFGIR